MFRGKFLAALAEAGLTLPADFPEKWVVDCKCVGNGHKALVYLGRYLYRGVIQERDIIGCDNGQVTYRWRDSKTNKTAQRTVSGATFLWLVLQHVLPKGFRRARNSGFLHPNSQAFDFADQVVGVQAAFVPVDPSHCACATTPIAVRLLWVAHGDRAVKDIAIHCRATDARA